MWVALSTLRLGAGKVKKLKIIDLVAADLAADSAAVVAVAAAVVAVAAAAVVVVAAACAAFLAVTVQASSHLAAG